MQINKVLYFSLSRDARDGFHIYARRSRATFKHSFRLMDEDASYEHASDLLVFLDQLEREDDLGHTYVIIDYLSLCVKKSNAPHDSWDRGSDIIELTPAGEP